MRLLVCYGGTFDPVHNGHLAIACAVRDALAAEVRLIPAADPPHKDEPHADARHRERMLTPRLHSSPPRGLRGPPAPPPAGRIVHRDTPPDTGRRALAGLGSTPG